MNPFDITWSTYIDFDKENNKEDPIYKADDNVRILKYIFVFAKGYVLNCSEEVFGIKKIKIMCREHMLLVMLIVKKLLERFAKKNWKK